MKTKGFTLIELLAVIVVLAIIALIATPLVMNTINNAKKGAAERSAEGYLKQIQTRIMEGKLNGSKLDDGIYKVTSDGKLCAGLSPECDSPIEIEVNGNRPTEGDISIRDGSVGAIGLKINGEKVGYDYGDVVNYNVTTGEKCENGAITGKTGCLKFYVAGANGDRIKLLLDHNTTIGKAWNASKVNTAGPDAAFLNQLKIDTTGWVAEKPSSYTDPAENYTIEYTTNARLLTANEVAQITGNPSWDSGTLSGYYYFDSNTQTRKPTCKSGDTSGCRYGWLYDRTSSDCKTYGCSNDDSGMTERWGFWTASADANNSSHAWTVYFVGFLSSDSVYGNRFGVRPVIEVLKSKLV